MNLIQYKFALKNNVLFEEISELLFDNEAISVDAIDAKDTPIFSTNEDPLPIWEDIIVSPLFNSDTFDLDQIRRSIKQILKVAPDDSVQEIQQQDWLDKWKQETSVCEIAPNLAIYPSHIKQPETSQKIINLDPGLAFGTGSHPTTRMCLEWISQNSLDDLSIIDFGCGSGILGIAAILFNASSVIALDNDPQALLATRNNCEKNNIHPEQIKTYLPEQLPDNKVDIIFANIYLNVLIDLKVIITNHLKRNGKILLTGLLLEQKDKLMSKYNGFKFTEVYQKDDWLMLVAEKH